MIRYSPFDVSPWRILDEMMDVDRRLNRVLRATAERVSGCYPRVNLYSSDQVLVVHAEMPGVDPAQVEVSVDSNVLTIKGKRPGETEQERTFERNLELPFAVSEDGLGAQYARGVLSITLPKAPEAKPRRIEIKQS